MAKLNNPEDIFSSTNKIEQSAPRPITRPRFEEVIAATRSQDNHTMRLGITLLVIFFIILIIVSFLYINRPKQNTNTNPAATTKQSFLGRLLNPTQSVVATPLDSDGDGLSDDQEINTYHTDPHKIDTDGDGLTDREEVMVYHTNPNKADTDGDGINDKDEISQRRDPLNPDPKAVWPPIPQSISVK